MPGKIILTDWPKPKQIMAHVRGVETERLQKIHGDMFHFMVNSHSEEAGGYSIIFYADEVKKELEFRKIPIKECYCHD